MVSTTRRQDACLVISHYNAWPDTMLVALLDQTQSVPAGMGFHTRVVVNAAEDKPLLLPSRHAAVEVLYRENAGYNIAAWNLGWRAGPRVRLLRFFAGGVSVVEAGMDGSVRAPGDETQDWFGG